LLAVIGSNGGSIDGSVGRWNVWIVALLALDPWLDHWLDRLLKRWLDYWLDRWLACCLEHWLEGGLE